MWQQASVPDLNWKEALAYCEGLELAGYADWRLPDRNELLSLVDYTRSNPAILATFFPDTSSFLYWTSTTQLPDPKYAFIVQFEYGSTYGALKSSRPYVRAVRTISGTPSTTTTTTIATTTTTIVNSTTTTSAAAATTTTTTAAGRLCPSQKVLGANSPELDSLRDFRDSRLAQSAMGRKIIQIYYANAGSINAALDRSPALRATACRLLELIAPMVGKH